MLETYEECRRNVMESFVVCESVTDEYESVEGIQ